ncbi:ankyrin repeat-containing domain protein [Aspergillus aurantiobrunneus]
MPLITLTPDEIDDLIHSVRAADVEALESDLATLTAKYNVKHSVIIASAIDSTPEEEGGSGCCLLHYPAANGNLSILKNLVTLLLEANSSINQALTPEVKGVVNHRNHSGNTPLHWAALNTHLQCVKLLVEAGADVSIKNEAGLDAIFLAERTDWKTQDETSQNQPADGVDEAADAGPVSKGRQVVEWLLEFGNPAEVQVPGREESEEQQE